MVEMIKFIAFSGEDEYIFMGIVRPIQDRPITDLSMLEANQDQYITRHLPDGRIIFADHRYIILHVVVSTFFFIVKYKQRGTFSVTFADVIKETSIIQEHLSAL